jgi:bacteriocin biosynthesis cyclodehydratase domain-containing protein
MTEPICLGTTGRFGATVGSYLAALRPDIQHVNPEGLADPHHWPSARVSILAASRPEPGVCTFLDELSHERKRPFIPLVAEFRSLRLGPIVVPGNGGCWRCWNRRTLQHSSHPTCSAAMHEHYATHPDAGPKGYLRPFAMIGAAWIVQIIQTLDLQEHVGGHVWEIDLLTREISTSQVVGIHDCPRCGLHRDSPGRSFVEMRQALSHLWES